MIIQKDVILVAAPFSSAVIPSLALGTLTGSLKEKGISTGQFYANLLFMDMAGMELYEKISFSSTLDNLGEYLFAPYAFKEVKKKLKDFKTMMETTEVVTFAGERLTTLNFKDVLPFRKKIKSFIRQCVKEILKHEPKIVGFTANYQQIGPSIALARELKKQNPGIITAIGGYSTSIPMADALAKGVDVLDYVLSGEGDIQLPLLCEKILKGEAPGEKVIDCAPVRDLDSLPYPELDEYFEQIDKRNINRELLWLNLETSRGCWWGEKATCIFCGYNCPDSIGYRQKSFPRIKEELIYFARRYKVTNLMTADKIMPKGMAEQALKDWKEVKELKNIFYQLRPNLSFEELGYLKGARVNVFQAGIESLNDHLLKLIRKGMRGINNVRFLRDCQTHKLSPSWSLLYSIPGEKEEDYREMMELIPKIYHIHPPVLLEVAIQRYSPLYENNKEKFHFTPHKGYSYLFPDHMDFNELALFFDGDYPKVMSNKNLRNELQKIIADWVFAWKKNNPVLYVIQLTPEHYLVHDTRPVSNVQNRALGPGHYHLLEKCQTPVNSDLIKEEIQRYPGQWEELKDWNFILSQNGWHLSLVTDQAKVWGEGFPPFSPDKEESFRPDEFISKLNENPGLFEDWKKSPLSLLKESGLSITLDETWIYKQLPEKLEYFRFLQDFPALKISISQKY